MARRIRAERTPGETGETIRMKGRYQWFVLTSLSLVSCEKS